MSATSSEAAPDSRLGEEPAVVDAVELQWSGSQDASSLTGSSDATTTSKKTPLQQAQEQAAWHEDRIRRRLQNEYERAGKALSDIVAANLDAPLRLNAIRIVGARHTRSGFLARVASRYLSEDAPQDNTTPTTDSLRKVLQKTRGFTDALQKLDIFSEIEAGLENAPGVMNDEQDVDLAVKVRESGKYFLKTASDVGDGEGSASVSARVRNTFGGAETLEANASFGTRTKSAFQVRLSAPILADPTSIASLSGFAIERDLSHFASCRERLRGAKLSVKGLSPLGEHEVAYDGVLRNLCDVGKSASMSIRNAAGLSVKSALSHTLLHDTRDDPVLSTRGSYFRAMQEYAGLGGDANFVKSENEAHIARSLGNGYTLSAGLRAGLLYPLGGKPSHFLDRFQLGGPTSVRMFRINSLGPKDNGDYLGGDLHWAAGLSLITPCPFKPEWPVKGHLFVNAGRLTPFDRSLSKSFSGLLQQPSVAVGVGMMYRLSIVRLEANIGVPIAAHKSDGSRKGLQVGIGLHFL